MIVTRLDDPALLGYKTLVVTPDDYEPSQAYPLVLFLHGRGERGDDLDSIASYALLGELSRGRQLAAIVVAPLCPLADELWDVERLVACLDQVETLYRVDPTRRYLTGLSMGGHGAWTLAMTLPDHFAALVPICGWGDVALVSVLKDLPVWAFHGRLDTIVPLVTTQTLVDALGGAGGHVRFTVYDDLAHPAWTRAYATDELYIWLLAQQRI